MKAKKTRLNLDIPTGAAEILDRLHNFGYPAYIVGGYVRNAVISMLGEFNLTEKNNYTDIDICTSATPETMLSLFTDKTVVPTGLKHGTVTVVIDHIPYEVTTFRRDGEYSDHRRPDKVYFSSELYEDLRRRDFTINAMAYDGEYILDYFDGEADLKNRIIRCVGNPERRFSEDALRILRALRFASQLDFEIEYETESYVYEMADLLKFVSIERSVVELQKLLVGKGAERISEKYLEVLRVVFPKINPLPKKTPDDIFVRMASVFDNEDSLRGLKLSRKTEQIVKFLIRNKNTNIPTDRIEIKRFLREYGYEYFHRLCVFRKNSTAQAICEDIEARSECYSLSSLQINGSDLIKIGIKEGPIIRDLLSHLLDKVIKGEIKNERSELLSYVETQK